jgi:hypothetical protein
MATKPRLIPGKGREMAGKMGKMPMGGMGKMPTDMPSQAKMPFKKGGMVKKGRKGC